METRFFRSVALKVGVGPWGSQLHLKGVMKSWVLPSWNLDLGATIMEWGIHAAIQLSRV